MLLRASLAVLAASAALAQDRAPASRPAPPRIGLVLSGGGARGAAHAGVLEVLEEMRIPIHCIAGTSMGSIVGGLYAYGHSPRALQDLLTRAGSDRSWADLLRDGPPREDLDFRRKEEDRSFQAKLRVGVHEGSIAFPLGFIQGQGLETELRFLTLGAHDLRSFDELPIPYRCVAVDIVTGDQVVLQSGNLANAMRASMSLPGIFAPTTIDGRVLVDGGLLKNVPMDVARAMGVDVLIVVDIGTPLAKEAVRDLFGVSGKMVAILTQQNVNASLATLGKDDVLIQPDLGDITSADFTRAGETIAIGAKSTRAVAERLRRFSVSEEQYADFLRRQRRSRVEMPRIRKVILENDSGLGDEVLTTRLGVEEGAVLDEKRFRKGLDDVYGLDDFQRVEFSVRELRDGAGDLRIRAEAKDWGPSYLRFGLELESRFRGASTYNVSGQYTMRELNALGAEWRNDVRIGSDDLLRSEFYQPLDVASAWFVAPRVQLRNQPISEYQGDDLVALQHVRTGTLGLDGGRKLGVWAQVRVGIERTIGEVDVDLASVPQQGPEFDDTVVHASFEVDTLDDPRFPTRGNLGKLQWRAGVSGLGADGDYQLVRLSALHVIPFGRTTITPMLRIESTLSGTVPAYSEPTLGGFLKLSGLARDQLRGQQVGFAGIMGRHRLSQESLVLGFPLYVGASVETGNAWNRESQLGHDLRAAGSAFVACDTPLGPCYVAFGLADGGDESAYFFLGPLF